MTVLHFIHLPIQFIHLICQLALQFTASHDRLFKTYAGEAKTLQKQLEESGRAVEKGQAAYYRACVELMHAEEQMLSSGKAVAIKKRDDARDKRHAARSVYDMAVRSLNTGEKRVQIEVGDVLDYLEKLEAERLATTQTAMAHYVQITMEEMAELVGLQMMSELLPTIESIDPGSNLADFVDKSLQSRPTTIPGKNSLKEYDEVQDCPDDQRSVAMLKELGGGAVRTGPLDKEASGFIKKYGDRTCTDLVDKPPVLLFHVIT
eukprot:SAG31_NODE_290_length_18324_cov_33.408889_14_plen_262_part_00